MEPDVAGVLGQFKSIKKHANFLRQSIISDPGSVCIEDVESLVGVFKDAKTHFERIRHEQKIGIYLRGIGIRILETDEQKASYFAQLIRSSIITFRELDIECDKAIGVLESIATPLSKDELDKLTSLRKELEKLSEVLPDINYERNLEEAINEYEKGDYLASALISGRVIIYALNQIPGKSDEERVGFLKEKGIIGKGKEGEAIRKSIIKASRSARNFLSHNIKGFPAPSEALSLLSDAIGILEIVSKVLKEKEKS
jgi:hypothetical protein